MIPAGERLKTALKKPRSSDEPDKKEAVDHAGRLAIAAEMGAGMDRWGRIIFPSIEALTDQLADRTGSRIAQAVKADAPPTDAESLAPIGQGRPSFDPKDLEQWPADERKVRALSPGPTPIQWIVSFDVRQSVQHVEANGGQAIFQLHGLQVPAGYFCP